LRSATAAANGFAARIDTVQRRQLAHVKARMQMQLAQYRVWRNQFSAHFHPPIHNQKNSHTSNLGKLIASSHVSTTLRTRRLPRAASLAKRSFKTTIVCSKLAPGSP
jgi:hypothetical protein